jgi:hypothetical protein
MKKIVCFICFLLITAKHEAQKTTDADMLQLKALNARFINNFVTNDTVSHSKIIHPAFICIGSDGRYIRRNEYLQAWLHGFDGYTYWDYRSEDIKIFGHMALVRSQNKYVVENNGVTVTGFSIYTDTYIKENGEWKCVQAQLTKLAPEHAGNDETIVRKYDFRK